jgi:tetratricopeptide (TPR) repeat protein
MGAVLLLAGCPQPPVSTLATIRAEDLPADPALLDARAAELTAKGDAVSLENALVVLDKALAGGATYEREIQAARVAFLLGDEAEAEGDKPRRAKFAHKGEEYAKRAIAAGPQRAEGHYLRAIHLGFIASTKSIGALELLPEMAREAKEAIALDEKIDHAGPHRLLGVLLLRAPAWPTSLGDVDEGLSEMQKAVALAGDWPGNRLYYAEALIANDKRAEAKPELERVLAVQPNPEWNRELGRWRGEAERLAKKVK